MSWDSSKVHQDIGAAGRYNPSSALAQEYASLETNTSSRVDDEAGYRAIAYDSPPKNAEEYQALVDKWTSAGFKVRAIDMDGDDFTHSNIAVAPDDGNTAAAITPDDRVMSERLATAKERVKEYEDRAWSGESSQAIFGKDPGSFLGKYKQNFLANHKSRAKQTTAE